MYIKFQAKIPHRLFITKCRFWGVSKNQLICCMQMSCILPPRLQKRASRVGLYDYISTAGTMNSWLKQHNRARERVFSRTYGSQMHWKWDKTARCYNSLAALACHRRGSMARAAGPRYRTNLALRTVRANLTSAAPPAAQMYGENEDSYVQSYIQTEHGAACETTLQLL